MQENRYGVPYEDLITSPVLSSESMGDDFFTEASIQTAWIELRNLILPRPDPQEHAIVAAEEIATMCTSTSMANIVRMWLASDEFHRVRVNNPAFPIPQPRRDKPIVHVHNPKTGGTSLNKSLAQVLDPLRLFTQRPVREVFAYSLYELSQARFVACHGGRALVDFFAPIDATLFTVLREPTAHQMSAYRHHMRHHLLQPHVTFEDFMAQHLFLSQVDYFGWNALRSGRFGPLHGGEFQHRNWDESTADEGYAARLDEAKNTLNRMDLIGLTENLRGLYNALGVIIGGNIALPKLEIHNAAPSPAEINGLEGMVREFVPEDFELYEWARDKAV